MHPPPLQHDPESLGIASDPSSPRGNEKKTGRSHGKRPWAVVGGGMMGLTIAWRLARAGRQVVLYEASEQLGGLASPWQLGDVRWDRHYHVTLLSDSHTRGLLADLGLESGMHWVETKTGFSRAGKLVSMSNALEYLALPGLSLIDKLRIASTITYASKVHDWRQLEQLSVKDWLVRLSGESAFESLWLPLLKAKLGDGWRDASAAFIWATIQRLYAARRTGLKKELFGYAPGGYRGILERFERVLIDAGVQLKIAEPVSQVLKIDAGLRIESRSGSADYDRVVLTTTPRAVARMCPELAPEEKQAFNQVEYQGVVCASVLLRQPLAHYYLTYLTDAWVPFTAVVEMSAFVDAAEFGGHSLIYLPKYASAEEPIFSQSDEELRVEFLQALARLYPHFNQDQVLAFKVSRVREVFPKPRLDYSSHLPPIQTSLPGLTAISSAHIVNGTLNVNDTLKVAERAAKSLLFQDGFRVFLD